MCLRISGLLLNEGEILQCSREVSNLHDLFAVAIIKEQVTISHVP